MISQTFRIRRNYYNNIPLISSCYENSAIQLPQPMSGSNEQKLTHVALLPSAGMGHLTPFLRLAAALTFHNVQVTLITPHPTISLSESHALAKFFTSFPEVNQKQLPLLPLDKDLPDLEDPFYYHFEVIRRSVFHLLPSMLSAETPPFSAVIVDMSFSATVLPITQAFSLPTNVFFTSSAKMLALYISFHIINQSTDANDVGDEYIKIPGLEQIPKSYIPTQLLQNTNNLLKTYFLENGKKMVESNEILVNTSESLEQETLGKLNSSKVIEGLPSVLAIGPLAPCKFEKSTPLAWLDGQSSESVVYVCFGSRTAISREQIRELGDGLVRSGIKFLWVVKDKKVDREDDEALSEILGQELMERVEEKGLVVKSWMNQEDILSHPAVGGFISHCGWNSATEAIWHGVPILEWPQHGDQKINAEILESIGLGMWVRSWGWGEEMTVRGEEIAEMTRQMMKNKELRVQAMRVKEEARKAVAVGGSSNKGLIELIKGLKYFKTM